MGDNDPLSRRRIRCEKRINFERKNQIKNFLLIVSIIAKKKKKKKTQKNIEREEKERDVQFAIMKLDLF